MCFFLAEEHAVDKPVDQHLEGIIANEDAKEDGHELILRREDERVGNAVLCIEERHYRKQQARLQYEERLETQLVGSLRKFGGQRPGLIKEILGLPEKEPARLGNAIRASTKHPRSKAVMVLSPLMV